MYRCAVALFVTWCSVSNKDILFARPTQRKLEGKQPQHVDLQTHHNPQTNITPVTGLNSFVLQGLGAQGRRKAGRRAVADNKLVKTVTCNGHQQFFSVTEGVGVQDRREAEALR